MSGPGSRSGLGSDELAFLRALGKRLRVARRTAELSQRELADRAGMSRNFVSSIERGVHGVDVVRLVWLADALDLALVDLLPPTGAGREQGQGDDVSEQDGGGRGGEPAREGGSWPDNVPGLPAEVKARLRAAVERQQVAAAEPEAEREPISAEDVAALLAVGAADRAAAEVAQVLRQVTAAVRERTAADLDLDEVAEQTGTAREVVDRLVERLSSGELLVVRDRTGHRSPVVVLGADHPLMRALAGTPNTN